MKKILLVIFVAGVLIALGVYYYIFYFAAGHKDPLKQNDGISISAEKLYEMFQTYEDSANKTYVDKAIEVTGTINSIDESENRYSIILSTNDSLGMIACEMDTTINTEIRNLKVNSKVTVVGFCNGYNMDVELDRCKLAK